MKKYFALPFILIITFACQSKVDPSSSPAPALSPKVTESKSETNLIYEIRPPAGGITSQTPTLFLLHGYGSNEKDLFSFASYIGPNWLVICPRAPLTLMDGKYSWYPLNRKQDDWAYDATGLIGSSDSFLSFAEKIVREKGASTDKIFMGGFSQGAIMSLTTGLRYPEELAGIVSLSGQLYPEINELLAPESKLRDLKVFVSHGLEDEVLLCAPMQKTVKKLKAKGMNVEAHWYPTKHNISNDNFKDMLNWLATNS